MIAGLLAWLVILGSTIFFYVIPGSILVKVFEPFFPWPYLAFVLWFVVFSIIAIAMGWLGSLVNVRGTFPKLIFWVIWLLAAFAVWLIFIGPSFLLMTYAFGMQ